MKIILVKPSWTYPIDKFESTYNRIWPPLSLLNCAALLRNSGHEVKALDAVTAKIGPDELAEICSGYDMVFITSASLDRWQCPNIDIKPFLKSVEAVRKLNTNIFVMGTHGTVRPHEILELTEAKAVIRGEPEWTVGELAEQKDYQLIDGITFMRDEKIISNPDRKPGPLKDLPRPAFELLDYSDYFYEVLGERFILFETSRGCPFSCIFCVKNMYGPGYRVKNTQQVIDEIDFALDELNVRSAYFIDLEFTLNKKMVYSICNHIIDSDKKLDWCCQTRADSIDMHMLKIMKRAGCRIIHFGVETGSKTIAGKLKKNITISQIREGVRMTKKAGIQTVCFFMFGLPDETLEDMKKTIRLAKTLNPTYASFHIALPYPGTEFYYLVKEHIDDNLFPLAYTGQMSLKSLEKVVKKAFFYYYLRPNYLFSRIRDANWRFLLKQARFFMNYLKKRLKG